MREIAGGGDTRLHEQRLVVPDAKIGNRRAARDDFAKLRRGYAGYGAGKLNDRSHLRFVQAQSCHRTDNAFASYRRRFDRIAVLQDDKQRNHPAQRKENLIDLVIHIKQHRPLCHRNDGEVVLQCFGIGMRQGCQQFVGQRARCLGVQKWISRPVGLGRFPQGLTWRSELTPPRGIFGL